MVYKLSPMRYITKCSLRNRCLPGWALLILSFFCVLSSSAQEFQFIPDVFNNRLNGWSVASPAPIPPGGSATSYNDTVPRVAHNWWPEMKANPNWSTKYRFKSVSNIIRVGINHDTTMITDNYSYRIDLMIDGYANPAAPNSTVAKQLTVYLSYRKDSLVRFNDVTAYKIDGSFHAMQARIVGIYDSATMQPINRNALAKNFFVEEEIAVQRYVTQPQNIFITSEFLQAPQKNQLRIVWTHYDPATPFPCSYMPDNDDYKPVKYELEWTYVDGYKMTDYVNGTPGYKFNGPSFSVPYNFRNNATRVQTYGNTFTIPMIYEYGALVYRIRMVRPDSLNYSKLVYSNWNMPDVGTLTDQSFYSVNQPPYQCVNNCLYIITRPQTNDSINWQHTVTFAEEGKYKNVVNYFDGSGRNRQSQTRINTDQNYVIAADKIYDYGGRPSIQTLPVPVLSQNMEYKRDLTLNQVTGQPYRAADFDKGCADDSIPGLHSSALASRYYSRQNPDTAGMQKFVPDAKGYPFMQTIYTPDNTSKVSWQGGPGKEMQLFGKHGTHTVYARADQYELNRLMGTEVGRSQYYPKQIVTDPNNQASFSIVNPAGKTIATALVGKAPDSTLIPITPLNNIASVSNVTIDILANIDQTVSNGLRLAEHNFFAEANGTNYLRYGVSIPPYGTSCAGQYINVKGYYKYNLVNECGVVAANPSGEAGTSGFSSSAAPQNFSGPAVPAYLTADKYTLTKELYFPDTAIVRLANEFTDIHTGINDCYVYRDSFVRRVVDAEIFPCKSVDTLGPCGVRRAEMIADLYPDAKYGKYGKDERGKFRNGWSNSIFTMVDQNGVEVPFPCDMPPPGTVYPSCMYIRHHYLNYVPADNAPAEPNNSYIPPCAQQCRFNEQPTSGTWTGETTDTVWADHKPCNLGPGSWATGPYVCMVSSNIYRYRYQWNCLSLPMVTYTDADNVTHTVNAASLDPQTLIDNFNDDIAEALLPLHPEYCKLSFCDDDFDKKIGYIDNYQEAAILGMNTLPGIIAHDPLNQLANPNGPLLPLALSTFAFDLTLAPPNNNLLRFLDTFSLEQAYCISVSPEGYMYNKNRTFASKIQSMDLGDANLKDIYFDRLRTNYLSNRNFLKQRVMDTSTHCTPCQQLRMTLMAPPVFPQIFTGNGNQVNVTDSAGLAWVNNLIQDGLNGTNFTQVPSNITNTYNSGQTDRAVIQVRKIMSSLANCGMSITDSTNIAQYLITNFCNTPGNNGAGITPDNVKTALAAYGIPLTDLCTPFLAEYGMFDDRKQKDRSNYVPRTKAFYEGLQNFLNRPQIKEALVAATATGGTMQSGIPVAPSTNEYESALSTALNGATLLDARGYVITVQEGSFSFGYPALVIMGGGTTDTIFFARRQLSSQLASPLCTNPYAPTAVPFQGASSAAISFSYVRNFIDEPGITTGKSQIAPNFALLNLNGTISGGGACEPYAIWSSRIPMARSTDPEALDYCVNCVQLQQAVADYFSYSPVYKLPTYSNHPLFGTALTNYLNFYLKKNHSFDEYQRLMKGCALSDKMAIRRSTGNFKIDFIGAAWLNGFLQAFSGTFSDINLSTQAYFINGAGARLLIDLKSVPANRLRAVKNYIQAYSNGVISPPAYQDQLPSPFSIAWVFVQNGATCNFAGLNVPNTTVSIPYSPTRLPNFDNSVWYDHTLYQIDCNASDPLSIANATQAVKDYLAANNCIVGSAIYAYELYRSDDYSNPDKQAYLSYVYGLGTAGQSADQINNSIAPGPLQTYGGIAAITGAGAVSYRSPACSNVKEDLFYSATTGAGHPGWNILSQVISQVSGQLSGSLFTNAATTVINPGSLGGGGTSLKAFRMSDGGTWYRFFNQQNKLYNVYLYPSQKMVGDPGSYHMAAVNALTAVPEGDSMYHFKVMMEKSINGNTHSVPCYGYTDFAVGTGHKLSNVVLFDHQNKKGCTEVYNCEKALLTGAINTARILHVRYIDSIKESHIRGMRNHYAANAVDTLLLTTQKLQYQYTLYYYDRAGNLERTVPPQGVDTLAQSGINQVDANRNAGGLGYLPNHRKVSMYRYNAMNQLTWQKTPDGDTSTFFYDNAGRLVFSQNAVQRQSRKYSYTLYDEQGRITETGAIGFELNEYAPGSGHPNLVRNSGTTDISAIIPQVHLKARQDVVATFYDNQLINLGTNPGMSAQANLRKRVSSILYAPFVTESDTIEAFYAYGTHFSYDALGNVSTLVQDNPYMDYMGQRFKRIDYDYDLLSGKVNMLSYNRGGSDQYYHKYEYDADNRITTTKSSKDGLIWDRDASYSYYKHGPLATMGLGDLNVQSIQYAYTIQGWLKAINGDILRPEDDMGRNGANGGLNPPDVIAHSLDYYQNDYKPIGSRRATYTDSTNPLQRSLYNGNIARQTTGIKGLDNLQRNYRYDQLNRISSADYMKVNNDLSRSVVAMANAAAFRNTYGYDADGNIQALTRNNEAGTMIDNFTYNYQSPTTNNKLGFVADAAANTGGNDLPQGQAGGNYVYDRTGNLVKDVQGHIDSIYWNLYGKVSDIEIGTDTTIHYDYDGSGNRVRKDVIRLNGSGNGERTSEVYVRDAAGNILAVYRGTSMINGSITIQWVNDDIVRQHGGWVTPNNTGLGPFVLSQYGNNGQFTGPLIQIGIDNNPGWGTQQSSSLSLGQYLTLSDGIFTRAVAEPIYEYFRPMADQDVKIMTTVFAGQRYSTFKPMLTALVSDKMDAVSYGTLLTLTQATPKLAVAIMRDCGLKPTSDDPVKQADQLKKFTLDGKGVTTLVTAFVSNTKEFDPLPFTTRLVQDKNIITDAWLKDNPRITDNLKKNMITYAPRDNAAKFFEGWLQERDGNWLEKNSALNDRLLVVYHNDRQAFLINYLDNIGIKGLNQALRSIPQLTLTGYLHGVQVAVLTGTLNPTYRPPVVNTPGPNNLASDTLYLAEHHLYGSSRLGIKAYDKDRYRNVFDGSIAQPALSDTSLSARIHWYSAGFADWIKKDKAAVYTGSTYNISLDTLRSIRNLGSKQYELSDHLGNVLAVVLDRKSGYGNNGGVYAGFNANLASINDYYPFGMLMPGRNGEFDKYRFGFNGQEEANEIAGVGNNLDFKFRGYDSRIGRFWSIDPMVKSFPWNSSYAFAENRPIDGRDLEGKEWDYAVDDQGNTNINVNVGFTLDANLTSEQVGDYKKAINNQLNNTLSSSSGGKVRGSITFNGGTETDRLIPQFTLYAKKFEGTPDQPMIAGSNNKGSFDVNIYNKDGSVKTPSEVAEDVIHELLHTVRVAHPFERTQGPELTLKRVGKDAYSSTSITDKNIQYNIMNYPMISIDGQKLGTLWKSKRPTLVTESQLKLMINEINLQRQGYGIMPKYDKNASQDQNDQKFLKYYNDYWMDEPGTDVIK